MDFIDPTDEERQDDRRLPPPPPPRSRVGREWPDVPSARGGVSGANAVEVVARFDERCGNGGGKDVTVSDVLLVHVVHVVNVVAPVPEGDDIGADGVVIFSSFEVLVADLSVSGVLDALVGAAEVTTTVGNGGLGRKEEEEDDESMAGLIVPC